jgi:hypothetical protein
MAEGKALHARLMPAAQSFRAERARFETLFAREKERSDVTELALIEKREGRKARRQVMNVMIRARPVLNLLPSEAKPVVDMPAFESALASYGSRCGSWTPTSPPSRGLSPPSSPAHAPGSASCASLAISWPRRRVTCPHPPVHPGPPVKILTRLPC